MQEEEEEEEDDLQEVCSEATTHEKLLPLHVENVLG
jgi:hypothetical protein